MCGTKVRVQPKARSTEYKGNRYYICSQRCLEMFKQDPQSTPAARYLRSKASGRSSSAFPEKPDTPDRHQLSRLLPRAARRSTDFDGESQNLCQLFDHRFLERPSVIESKSFKNGCRVLRPSPRRSRSATAFCVNPADFRALRITSPNVLIFSNPSTIPP